jgi:Bacteriocin-protection, YdeI or OmpD-Associated
LLLYALSLAVSIAAFFLIRSFGNSLAAPGAPARSKPAGAAFSEASRITDAKRPETKKKRLVHAVEWIAQGKSWNWKYEKC